jgi:hypothetical protein
MHYLSVTDCLPVGIWPPDGQNLDIGELTWCFDNMTTDNETPEQD